MSTCARASSPLRVAHARWMDAFDSIKWRFPPHVSPSIEYPDNLCGPVPRCLSELLDLLSCNAIEAMPRGGPLQIAVCEQPLPPDDGNGAARRHLRLTFRDAGLGMTELMLQRVFDRAPLNQCWGHNIVERLRQARSVTRQHGGKFFVESALGYGTQVEIYLPSVASLRDLDLATHGVAVQ